MVILGVPEAAHYCSSFQPIARLKTTSTDQYVETELKGKPILKEGTTEFNEYRICSLREAERYLFFAVSNYRRALDLMLPSASGWAHVTLYYSAFYTAHALLAMFGGWIGRSRVIEVQASQPGNQELILRKVQTTRTGSHERFWELFYTAMAPLQPWIDAKLRFAVTPVSGNIGWLAQSRNEVNYDPSSAYHLATSFQTGFAEAQFPDSLPGDLNTQFSVAEGLLLLAAGFVDQLSVATDALESLTPAGHRRTKLEDLVFQAAAPNLVDKTKWQSVLV